MGLLKDRVALVAGVGIDLGTAIARVFAEEGANLVLAARSEDTIRALADEIEGMGRKCVWQCADITDAEACKSLVARTESELGGLDILVNNASSFYPTPPGDISEAQWDDLVGANLKAPLFLSQAAITELRATHGAIINIVDIHSQRPLRNHTVYGVAKAGLAMLTRSLAKDLAPDIRVNGVSPGAILWPEDDMTETTRNSILGQIPLKRPGDPDDIAACVLFLARDATYVTGQVIAVDGGRSIGW